MPTYHPLPYETEPEQSRQEERIVEYRASGTFDLTKTMEPPYDDAAGAVISRGIITKEFHGDLVGTSITHITQAMSERNGSAGYIAMERVIGALEGRSGTFVLQHNATMTRGAPYLNIIVVPDSGTGDLVGLTGSMNIIITDSKHFYEFDYAFAERP